MDLTHIDYIKCVPQFAYPFMSCWVIYSCNLHNISLLYSDLMKCADNKSQTQLD